MAVLEDEGKEEDEWRREKERTADGSAKKRERGGGMGRREAARARKSEEF